MAKPQPPLHSSGPLGKGEELQAGSTAASWLPERLPAAAGLCQEREVESRAHTPPSLLTRHTAQGKGLLLFSHEFLSCYSAMPSQGIPVIILLLSPHQEFFQRCHLTTQNYLVTLS